MKRTSLNLLKNLFMLLGLVSLVTMYSCKGNDDDPVVDDPIASFQFEVSADNWQEVTFTNYSTNATVYSWNFGDGESSTEANPVHTYAAEGNYTVVLTATNSADVSATYEQVLTVTDPNSATALLHGGSTKVWKLFREGSSMGIGSDADNARVWWSLTNDGSRPCLYKQTFTFGADGSFVFDDMGSIFGEGDIWGDSEFNEICFAPTADNMVNKDGADVSAWQSGTHTYSYDVTTGKLTLTGTGAYLGIVKCGTSDYTTVPLDAITYDITIEEFTGYDIMTVSLMYTEAGNYWDFSYVSYSDPSLEPDLVEEAEVWVGDDLEDISPSSMKVTFASRDAADLVELDTIASASTVDFGVDDPADATAAKVGKFNRTDASYQELQFQTYPTKKDIQFDNLTSVSIDVYIPSSNDYTGTLTKGIKLGYGDISETEGGWWNDNVESEVADSNIVTDAWKTYTFDLTDAKARTDLDMIYIQIGGGGHAATGTFYVRNLIFE